MLTQTKTKRTTHRRQIAVISGDEPTVQRFEPSKGAAVLIPLDCIETNPLNPREEFDEEKIRSLAASMRHVDLLHPIHVEPMNELGSRFRLVAGERRYRAAEVAGWQTIPCVVCAPGKAPKIMAAENLERENLNPIERARSLRLLTRPVKEGGAGMTTTEVAAFLGKSRPWAANLIRLLKLPKQWQERIASKEISPQAARHIASFWKRPDVLEAIEAGYVANPEAWRRSEDMGAAVQAIVQLLDGGTENADGAEQAEIETEAEAAATPARRAVPVSHQANEQERYIADNNPGDPNPFAVQAIVELIRELRNPADVDRVQEALDARRQALANGRGKS